MRDLVTWLLAGTPDWSRQRFEQTIKSGETTPVQLETAVPIYLTYVTAWSTGEGVTHFRDDIYGRDGIEELQMTSAL